MLTKVELYRIDYNRYVSARAKAFANPTDDDLMVLVHDYESYLSWCRSTMSDDEFDQALLIEDSLDPKAHTEGEIPMVNKVLITVALLAAVLLAGLFGEQPPAGATTLPEPPEPKPCAEVLEYPTDGACKVYDHAQQHDLEVVETLDVRGYPVVVALPNEIVSAMLAQDLEVSCAFEGTVMFEDGSCGKELL